MKTFHLRQRSEADGQLRLDIPVGKADAPCEIVVVVEPTVALADWLPGFWEQLSQGWRGEPLRRPPQGESETREPLGIFQPNDPLVQQWKEIIAENRRRDDESPDPL